MNGFLNTVGIYNHPKGFVQPLALVGKYGVYYMKIIYDKSGEFKKLEITDINNKTI